MAKSVAGTILFVEQEHSFFLVRPGDGGRYDFFSTAVKQGLTPLATILDVLRTDIGIDVGQLRLSDLTTERIEGENVSLFVFDHLTVDSKIKQLVAKSGLDFVAADKLRNLFTNVRIDAVPFFNAHLN